jgi:hypothetical protein
MNYFIDLGGFDLRRFESALDGDCAQVMSGG